MRLISRDQIETPALIIDLDILEANIQKMSTYLKDKTAKLRPHFKTHKCPMIAHMQLAAGAKGISCAKLGEAEVLAATGIQDILIANQVVDTPKICRLAALANHAKMTVCVDNEPNITELSEAAVAYGSLIHVLVEIDVGMGRCGVNTKEAALILAKCICESNGLVFEGIQAYAGQLSHMHDRDERLWGFREVNRKITEIKEYLEENGVAVKEISGGSTGTFNITGNNTIWTEIQAGSYVFMDTGYEALGLEFEKSLTVLTTVIHKRPGAAVTDVGLKGCGTDQGPPSIRNYPWLRVIPKEEHSIILDEKDELKYLQKLEYDPAHCCSTANLYDEYHCVRKGLLEAVWPIWARGKGR